MVTGIEINIYADIVKPGYRRAIKSWPHNIKIDLPNYPKSVSLKEGDTIVLPIIGTVCIGKLELNNQAQGNLIATACTELYFNEDIEPGEFNSYIECLSKAGYKNLNIVELWA